MPQVKIQLTATEMITLTWDQAPATGKNVHVERFLSGQSTGFYTMTQDHARSLNYAMRAFLKQREIEALSSPTP